MNEGVEKEKLSTPATLPEDEDTPTPATYSPHPYGIRIEETTREPDAPRNGGSGSMG